MGLAEKTRALLRIDQNGTVRLKTRPDGSVLDPDGLKA